MNTQILSQDFDNNVSISKASKGFYKGFNHTVTFGSKALILSLVLWAILLPTQAASTLSSVQGFVLEHFGSYYIYAMALFAFACIGLALIPHIGNIRLGGNQARPEFSRFSWFSMMFGAGIGVGMLTYATGEPIYHFANNPDII